MQYIQTKHSKISGRIHYQSNSKVSNERKRKKYAEMGGSPKPDRVKARNWFQFQEKKKESRVSRVPEGPYFICVVCNRSMYKKL